MKKRMKVTANSKVNLNNQDYELEKGDIIEVDRNLWVGGIKMRKVNNIQRKAEDVATILNGLNPSIQLGVFSVDYIGVDDWVEAYRSGVAAIDYYGGECEITFIAGEYEVNDLLDYSTKWNNSRETFDLIIDYSSLLIVDSLVEKIMDDLPEGSFEEEEALFNDFVDELTNIYEDKLLGLTANDVEFNTNIDII
jgi:hypothetical protein